MNQVLYAKDEIPTVHFNVTEFEIVGDNPLDEKESKTALEPFLGEHEGLEGLLEAAAELESALLKSGYSFHRVILPPQTMEAGRIKLEVVVFKLANIDVTGNKFFSDDNIKASLPGLRSGTVPDTTELSRELIIANNHPSKEVTIRIKHSRVQDSVDAELAVQDSRPWQFFAVLNNIGNDETGDFRISAGFQHNNLLNLDDSLTLSYTTSPDHSGDVKQYGFNYRLPLYPISGSLSFMYSRSDVDSGRIEQVFDVSGAGKFIGGQYTHTFLNINNYRHRLSVGVDDKRFENNISFQGIPLGVDVRSRPLTLSYSGEYRLERSSINFQFSYIRNLQGGNLNNNRTYALARAGAKQTWEAFRFFASSGYLFSTNWYLTATLNGQYSGEPLISGEQFGLGGSHSIRGFEERAVTGDKGIRLSVETWTPPLKYGVRLLGFVDTGYIDIEQPAVGQINSDTLLSLGLGIRWQWQKNLSLEVDYGHELIGAETPNAGGVKTHLALMYRF